MGKSLQDQLKALGLAKEKQAIAQHGRKAPVKREPHKKVLHKKEPHNTQPEPLLSADLSLEAAYHLREQQTRQQADRAREHKKRLELERRRLNETIRDVIMPHRLNDEAAELTRNFLYRGRIRKVRVTPGQLKSLNEGTLGLVYLAGGYHILESAWVKVVSQLSQEHVPDLAGNTTASTSGDEEFPVPDDLLW